MVVYTKKEELNEVWLDIAANLRPDLCDPLVPLRGSEDDEEWWERVDPAAVAAPSEDAQAAFLLKGSAAIGAERKTLIEDLRRAAGTDVPKSAVEAFLRYHVAKRQVPENAKLNEKLPPTKRRLQGRFEKDKPYRVQVNGCFAVVVNKLKGEQGKEVDQIFDCLVEALLDWNPNFLQILICRGRRTKLAPSLESRPRTLRL